MDDQHRLWLVLVVIILKEICHTLEHLVPSSFRIIFSFDVSGLCNPFFSILTVSQYSFVPSREEARLLSLSQVVVIHLFFAVLFFLFYVISEMMTLLV